MTKRKPKVEPVAEPGGVGSLYWHIHHEMLVEVLTEPLEARLDYIRNEKSRYESPERIAHRLKLIKPVTGQLPESLAAAISEQLVAIRAEAEARAVTDNAWAVFADARDAWLKSKVPAQEFESGTYPKYPDDIEALREAYLTAQQAGTKTWQAAQAADIAIGRLISDDESLAAFHATECPDCTWDGKTIFSKAFEDSLKAETPTT